MKNYFALLFMLVTTAGFSQTKILFDATKAESAGCADWIIDADSYNLGWGPNAYLNNNNWRSNAQRIPTPAQSGITSTTTEDYWTGGLSAWAVDCVKKGYIVETLPYNGQITYNNTSNPQDLKNYKVFIVDEPNINFTTAEKAALMQFVNNGGGLFMISDHTISDRNGDNVDSPMVWNDFLTNNGVQSNPFGISFDLVDISGTSTSIVAAANDPIIHGTAGNVTKVQWANGTTMTINPTVNSSVKAVAYKTGTNSGNNNVLFAYATYGNGKVCAIGDSSPTDDGTGNPNAANNNCSLYNGYSSDASGNHQRLLMNATIWLATSTLDSPSFDVSQPMVYLSENPIQNNQIALYNPSNSAIQTVDIYSLDGKKIDHITLQSQDTVLWATPNVSLASGFYLLQVQTENARVQTLKVLVQ